MTTHQPKHTKTLSPLALTLIALTLDGSAIFAASSSRVGYQSKLDTAGSTSNRYLSGTLAYGNKYWSYAKVAWMQPINSDANNPLYLSLDFMNHLHHTNNHSRELGAGLVYRMHTGVDNHLGMGGFYRYYVSWNNLKHWTPRVAVEYGNQDWLLTSNYYFKGTGTKSHDTATKAHESSSKYFIVDEGIAPGFDVIADYRWSNVNLQGFGYRYQQEEGRENLLNQGLGLEMAYHYAMGQDRTAKPFVKYTHDSKHGSLWNIGFKLSMGHEKNRPMATSDPDAGTESNNANAFGISGTVSTTPQASREEIQWAANHAGFVGNVEESLAKGKQISSGSSPMDVSAISRRDDGTVTFSVGEGVDADEVAAINARIRSAYQSGSTSNLGDADTDMYNSSIRLAKIKKMVQDSVSVEQIATRLSDSAQGRKLKELTGTQLGMSGFSVSDGALSDPYISKGYITGISQGYTSGMQLALAKEISAYIAGDAELSEQLSRVEITESEFVSALAQEVNTRVNAEASDVPNLGGLQLSTEQNIAALKYLADVAFFAEKKAEAEYFRAQAYEVAAGDSMDPSLQRIATRVMADSTVNVGAVGMGTPNRYTSAARTYRYLKDDGSGVSQFMIYNIG